MEIWKDVAGYEGLYQVSNMGNVRSLPRPRTSGRIMSQSMARGYKKVALCSNGGVKWVKVHRLVAETFIPNPNGLPQVNHKDENKLNNVAENLEWCDGKYNINYGTGILRGRKKAGKAKSKKVAQYSLDGELLSVWDSMLCAARTLNIAQGGISNCCLGKNKTAGGYVWKFA